VIPLHRLVAPLTPHFEIVLADERHWRFGPGNNDRLFFRPPPRNSTRGAPRGPTAHGIVPRGPALATAAKL
jgi:hypothetical protein